eukprot:gene2137-18186_t
MVLAPFDLDDHLFSDVRVVFSIDKATCKDSGIHVPAAVQDANQEELSFLAHQVIVAHSSSVLKTMLVRAAEDQPGEEQQPVSSPMELEIPIEEEEQGAAEVLIRHMYTGEFSQEVDKACATAISKLKGEDLGSADDINCICSLMSSFPLLCEDPPLDGLLIKCSKELLIQYPSATALCKSPQKELEPFLRLTFCAMLGFISSDLLKAESENDVLVLACHWVRHNTPSQSQLSVLSQRIRLKHLTPSFLASLNAIAPWVPLTPQMLCKLLSLQNWDVDLQQAGWKGPPAWLGPQRASGLPSANWTTALDKEHVSKLFEAARGQGLGGWASDAMDIAIPAMRVYYKGYYFQGAIDHQQTLVADQLNQHQPCLVADQINQHQPCLVADQINQHQPCLVADQINQHQPCLVADQTNQHQPCLVADQINQQQPCLVADQTNQNQPCLVADQINQHQPCLVADQSNQYQPLVADQLNQHQPCLVADQINQHQPCLVADQTNQHQPCLVADQINQHQPCLVADQTNQHQPCLVADQINQHQPCLVADQSNQYQPLVADQINQHQPCLVADQTNQNQPCLVADQINQHQPCLVADQSNQNQPLVADQINQHQPCLVADQTNQNQPCLVADQINQHQPCLVADQTNQNQPCLVADQLNQPSSAQLKQNNPCLPESDPPLFDVVFVLRVSHALEVSGAAKGEKESGDEGGSTEEAAWKEPEALPTPTLDSEGFDGYRYMGCHPSDSHLSMGGGKMGCVDSATSQGHTPRCARFKREVEYPDKLIDDQTMSWSWVNPVPRIPPGHARRSRSGTRAKNMYRLRPHAPRSPFRPLLQVTSPEGAQ